MQQHYYDAEIGRFISPDPVGPEEDFIKHFNRYNYAMNNPVRYTDPDGRKTLDESRSVSRVPLSGSRMESTGSSGNGSSTRGGAGGSTGQNNGNSSGSSTSGGNPETTPGSKTKTRSDGFVDGATSVVRGVYRGGRQVARSTGILGTDELKNAYNEGRILDEAIDIYNNNPEVHKYVNKKVLEALKNLPYDSPYAQGYIAGRVLTGIILNPLGVVASFGDGLQSLENGVKDPAQLLINAISGLEHAKP